MKEPVKTREEIINRRFNCPLSLLRIAKGLSVEEMAEIFSISKSHLYSYELEERNIKKDKLINGLLKLNINYDDYVDFVIYVLKVLHTNASIDKKYACALGRAIGLVNPELKNESKRVFKVPKKERKLKKD